MTIKKTGVLKPMAASRRAGAAAHGRLGICAGQTAVFAKGILDKYTKILNYQFDWNALVFLEREAGSEMERQPAAQVILMTCRLLSYLVRNVTQVNLFSNTAAFLGRQLTVQMERNLFMLQESSPKAYRELERYYKEYRELAGYYEEYRKLAGTSAAKGMEVSLKAAPEPEIQDSGSPEERSRKVREIQHRLQKQIGELEAAQKQIFSAAKTAGEAGGSGRAVTRNSYRMPFSLTHSFFANLNHCIEENRFQNYRRRWQIENERQIRQYELKCHMQLFLKEQDLCRQEEQLAGMIRQYGKESLRQYLQEADAEVFECVLPVLSILTGKAASDTARLSQNVLQKLPGSGYRLRQPDGNHAQMAGQPEKEDQENRLLAEYRQAEAEISLILSKSDEITKNVLLEKTEEYRELFYRYIRSEDLAHQPAGASEENPEIFSDAEIAVLLNRNDSIREYPKKIQTGKIQTEGIRAENILAKREILERKLNLLSFREISERFLQEESKFLQKEVLEQILGRLEHVSFSASGNGEQGEASVSVSGNRGQREASVWLSGNKEQNQREASVSVSGNGEQGEASVWLSGNKEKNQTVLQNLEYELMETADTAASTVGKERQTDDAVTDIRRVFEQGSLIQRKLYYLSMVRAVDEMLIEEQEKAEGQPADIRQLVQWKEQLQEADAQAGSAAGDWRFLLTKEAGRKLLHLVSRSPGQEQARFSQRVQQTVMNFYLKAANRHDVLSDTVTGALADTVTGARSDTVADTLSETVTGALSDAVTGTLTDAAFWMEWSGVFDQEEWEQLQKLAKTELAERKSKMRSQALQEWQGLFNKEELDALAKGNLIQKDPGGETDMEKRPYRRELQEQDLSRLMETAGLLERRLLHLSMHQAVNELLTEQDRHDETGHAELVQLKRELEEKEGTDSGLPQMISRMAVPVQNKIKESVRDIITQFLRQQNLETDPKTMQIHSQLLNPETMQMHSQLLNPKTMQTHSRLLDEWTRFFQQEELEVLAEGNLIQKDSGAGRHLQGNWLTGRMETASLTERKLLYLSAVHVTDGLLAQNGGNDREAYRQLDRLKKELQRPQDLWKAGAQGWDFLQDSDWNGRMIYLIQQMPASVQEDLTEGVENDIALFQRQSGMLQYIRTQPPDTARPYSGAAAEILQRHIRAQEPETVQQYNETAKTRYPHKQSQEPDTAQQYYGMVPEAVRQHVTVPQPEAVPQYSGILPAARWQLDHERLEILLQDIDILQQEDKGIRDFSLLQETDTAVRLQRADYSHYRKILQENRNIVQEASDMGLKIRSPQKFMQPPEPGETGPHSAAQASQMTEQAPFLAQSGRMTGQVPAQSGRMTAQTPFPVQSGQITAQAAADSQNREQFFNISAQPQQSGEQVFALQTVQRRQSGEQAGREESRKMQQLEGELLDYKNELRIRSDQLEQMEKMIVSQGKEIKVIQQSQHTVSKKAKSAIERRKVLDQIKNEIQMERMRTGRT